MIRNIDKKIELSNMVAEDWFDKYGERFFGKGYTYEATSNGFLKNLLDKKAAGDWVIYPGKDGELGETEPFMIATRCQPFTKFKTWTVRFITDRGGENTEWLKLERQAMSEDNFVCKYHIHIYHEKHSIKDVHWGVVRTRVLLNALSNTPDAKIQNNYAGGTFLYLPFDSRFAKGAIYA